jgi:hypothetical protein
VPDEISLSPDAWRRRRQELENLGATGDEAGRSLLRYRSDARIWGNPRAAAAADTWLAGTGAGVRTTGANVTEVGHRAGATADQVQDADQVTAADLATLETERE